MILVKSVKHAEIADIVADMGLEYMNISGSDILYIFVKPKQVQKVKQVVREQDSEAFFAISTVDTIKGARLDTDYLNKD